MGWTNLIVGFNELHSVAKAYANVVNSIANFFKPTLTTNIIPNKTILMQYSINQLLKVFGKKCKASLRKEVQKFHDNRVFKPKKPQDLSYEQQRRSLAYLIFLKLNIYEVTIKERGCTNGRKQQGWLSKEDTFSPTVSTEDIMLLCMIDTIESQELSTTDIPGAFLQTEYYKGDIHIKMEGAMSNLLEEINQEYYKYLI